MKHILENIKNFRFNRHEISGALGDMGLYLPLTTALVTVTGLNIVPVLFFSGLFNLLSGILFGIPICVQPMKAIATIAIAEGLTAHQVLAAGIVMGAVVLLISLTNALKLMIRWLPKSVIRGIQVGLGIKLLSKGISMIAGTNSWLGWDSILIGTLCAILILLLFANRRVPAALTIFTGGFVLAVLKQPDILSTLKLHITLPQLMTLTRADFVQGSVLGALPQLPLTLLNSVIAVCALSRDLFPQQSADEKSVGISIGLMNLIGCWFGAMPVCHGAGGLAGQYRYGARTGGSMVFLGGAKMLLAILFGAALLPVLTAYPLSVLGALLIFSGMELALLVKDVQRQRDLFVVFITTAGILVVNTAVGFGLGLLCAYLLSFSWIKIDHRQ